jgi:hypothetical protein
MRFRDNTAFYELKLVTEKKLWTLAREERACAEKIGVLEAHCPPPF